MEILENNNMKKLLDRNELRRLTKAARDKDIRKLADWGSQFEDTIRQEYEKMFEDRVEEDLLSSIDHFIIAIIYTLHFNEKCKFRWQKNWRFYGRPYGYSRWI